MRLRIGGAGRAATLALVLGLGGACGLVQDREATPASLPGASDEAQAEIDGGVTDPPSSVPSVTNAPGDTTTPSLVSPDGVSGPDAPPTPPPATTPAGPTVGPSPLELIIGELERLGPQCVDFARLKSAASPVFNNDANLPLPVLKQQMNDILAQAAAMVSAYPDAPSEARSFEPDLVSVVEQINQAGSRRDVYLLMLGFIRRYGFVVDEVVASLVTTCRFPDEPSMVRPAAEVARWLEEQSRLGT